ncbi:MAG: M48 family metallopeptidase [Chitinispirillales bacterium]|jgi:predicted metal-dependent hydrolase|nr:M48 family metallopeptidase [Chitinispirillales bacterium]
MTDSISGIPYKLIRSRRKTLALTIGSDAQLVVRAPMRLSEKLINDFIRRKTRWIVDKQQQLIADGAKQEPFVLEDGGQILFLGDSYTILRKDVADVSMELFSLIIPKDMDIAGFAEWMRARGEEVIGERVDYYAKLMGVKYASVKMSGAKRRWGSCGIGDSLNFAWRLVMCSPLAIDYVVVHELSHIDHRNHGAKFWKRVAAVMPNYKDAQKWLRVNRGVLEVL